MLVICTTWNDGAFHREIVGYKKIYIKKVTSSFQTEVAALELATDFVCMLIF